MPATHPVNVFFCYAPQDEELRNELEKHLALLEREGYVKGWSAGMIGAGDDARREIERQIDRADLILLLVSADFLASDQLYEVELRRALTRAERSTVVGILVRPCDWEHGEIGPVVKYPVTEKRQVLAVTAWDDRDAAFTSVAQGLRVEIKKLEAGRIPRNPLRAHPHEAPGG
jgi:hypothetical protein